MPILVPVGTADFGSRPVYPINVEFGLKSSVQSAGKHMGLTEEKASSLAWFADDGAHGGRNVGEVTDVIDTLNRRLLKE